MIYTNIDDSIQVHIPKRRSSQSFLTKMKCEVTSDTTHDVLISKEIGFKSYKEICSGEAKKVNLGYVNTKESKVQNNSMMELEKGPRRYIRGEWSQMLLDWEVFSNFFLFHRIEPNWMECIGGPGIYNEDLGGWTGCMGKV